MSVLKSHMEQYNIYLCLNNMQYFRAPRRAKWGDARDALRRVAGRGRD